MIDNIEGKINKLSVIMPCYNEENTLKKSVQRVQDIADKSLEVEIIIVDDSSTDNSREVAKKIENDNKNVILLLHKKNQGKGAAIRTGVKSATGDFVAIQDSDLEYNPQELKKLIIPLKKGYADVVIGSRFLSSGEHRVLYFWHSLGNKFLTLLSNMFTDLNLTDMESCYKVFKKDVIQNIDIEENRFGFEPEIIAKVAQKRLRIFEMGISYYGRTYEEGKKIGMKDGFRALYCIFHYNAHKAPLPIQFLIYFFIGSTAAIFNLLIFYLCISNNLSLIIAAPTAYIAAAVLNYFLSIKLLFRHKAKWSSYIEIVIYSIVVLLGSALDFLFTKSFIFVGFGILYSKIISTLLVFIFNFLGRKFLVFPEIGAGKWNPS